MSVPQRRNLTEALKALLIDKTGKPVEVATAPRKHDGTVADLPYAVVYPIAGGIYSGPELCSPEADVAWEYQIQCNGKRYDQTEWLMDLVRTTIIDRNNGVLVNRITFDDHVVMDQRIVGPEGTLDEVGQIWFGSESFAFEVTSEI